MDRSIKSRSRRTHRHRNNKPRKAPKVPIKTYRWEDVSRSRRRGGYPWTHLYKGPFTEKVDPEQFTMDAYRRAKSSSPMGRKDISEKSSWADYSGKTTPTLLQELINDPQEYPTKASGSVVIEDVTDDLDDDVQVKEFQTESAESSDNISQYLEKEERESPREQPKEVIADKEGVSKRKLSIESAHSRLSLTQGVLKKLQEARKSIKIPKITFSTKKNTRKRPASPKNGEKEKVKKPAKKSSLDASRIQKVDKPVYIHIPLKPPPGETDEFSHLEFKSNDKIVAEDKKEILESSSPSVKIVRRPPLKIKPEFKQLLKGLKELENKENKDLSPDSSENEETIARHEESSKKENTDEEQESVEVEKVLESPKEDVFEKLFTEAITSKPPETARNVRSKSAEPESKRRSSLESSYSRKSTSKLGLVKKLKDASIKIKNAFSVDNLRRKPSKTSKEPVEAKLKSVVKQRQLEKPKVVEPVYIHIPLKPPPGETDEFSYLENIPSGGAELEKPREERTDSLDSTSPKSDGIQFIFLTPPSDDEILDKDEPDIPETPSSEELVPFSSLKKLAQDVVDQVSPETRKSTLETVCEESAGVNDQSNEVGKMIVDVEDGLNENPSVKVDDGLKSALKSSEVPEATISPKRVSFKRKAKAVQQKEDNGYEPIEVSREIVEKAEIQQSTSKDETQIPIRDQSMSVDEEKTYLDQKIVKETSLEEDYNKWSNDAGDHEYEPISPPEEEATLPAVTIIQDLNDDEPKVVISATEILEPTKKKPLFQLGKFRKTSDSTSRSTSQEREVPTQNDQKRPNEVSQKLQEAFKQVKTKIHNVRLPKKPEFKRPHFKLLSKIPDRATIRLPHISLPGTRKTTETRTVETRHVESSIDESQTKKSKFDFKTLGGTFPRFKKKKKPKQEVQIFATVPRTRKEQLSTRIPLQSDNSGSSTQDAPPTAYDDRETSLDMDVGVEVEYERENREINQEAFLTRWQHGNFKNAPPTEDERIIGQLVEQRFGRIGQGYSVEKVETLEERLRKDEERPTYEEDEDEGFELQLPHNRHLVTDLDNLDEDMHIKDEYSSEGSIGLQQKGRLGKLDIDSDEFFVVHEIREGFQTPANTLAQMNEYDPIGSNRSLPSQIRGDKKPSIKKPKRKKTPHVSREEIPGDEESIEELLVTPSRPKRRSKRNKRRPGEMVPYQDTIPIEEPHGQRLEFPRESLGILGDDEDELEEFVKEEQLLPDPPPRRQRSLKSLTQSENDSLILPTESSGPLPKRPSRRSRSHTSSLSRMSLPPSQRDTDSIFTDDLEIQSPYPTEKPCMEETCVQNIADYMGYAIVDKSKPPREPPLPPPRTPPRRNKRAVKDKFATVPRGEPSDRPVRPVRNYSTLSHVKKTTSPYENDEENKENVLERPLNIEQYIEIDDTNRDLVSGEVVQKMRQRPLPAPPRPPRKPRSIRKSLQDITAQANIPEETVSVQTESLPLGFVCEPTRQEELSSVEPFELYDPRRGADNRIRREFVTPSVYSFEETVTHGTLLVKPLDGAKVVSDHQLSRERLVPITREDSEEISEIPESFKELRNPEEDGSKVVKTAKLEVTDLDVDRLTVNQLLASKVVVSEIDAATVATNEITGKDSGLVKIPAGLLEQLVKQLESQEEDTQKKISTNKPPEPPPRGTSLEESQNLSSVLPEMTELEVDDQPPPRPPQPMEGLYLPSQPPASFYALRAKQYVESNIPTVPRRKRHHQRSRPVSRSLSTSDEDSSPRSSRLLGRRAGSEPSIPELSGRLLQVCGTRVNQSLKRLIYYLTEHLLRNVDGNQDLYVFLIILLVLIAGLILLGYGEERTVVHLHHWEYFNPPKDL
ncbi:hypothetical protein ABEB36_001753 [Hypothenemus hampei]|uniref:Titin n=1 Tax=Hypothenemus hampei TaxID=57062 RepID=A0ABD1FG91_HYPHA